MSERLVAFPPVWRADAEILILGSMPSAASLEVGFYYGHPRNAFWRILSDVYGCPLPESIEQKRAILIEHRLALWDALTACRREGSLDSAIREPELNDFEGLFRDCPKIKRVLFNGGTAAKLFMKSGAGHLEGRQAVTLPSTSPAYTLSYERKLALWRQALVGML
ncbi:MAG: DNA-deoxyinosine glycosylase [Clostridia bacterium]|nr:DNA-deoxyinosine glycosylase [Clostridia bacterium]